MGKFIDITGMVFGRLKVLNKMQQRKYNLRVIVWECECICGKKIFTTSTPLRSGLSKSCGCLRREISRDRALGQKLSKSQIKKMANGRLGKKFPLERRRKISENLKGNKSSGWRGGIQSANKQARFTLDYKLWREAVFKRDNWTCVWCQESGGRLEADHIKPFAYFPEERHNVGNGRTLCHECHKKTDT